MATSDNIKEEPHTCSMCENTLDLCDCQQHGESNVLAKEVTKELVSQNILSMRVNFSCFHIAKKGGKFEFLFIF